jgi:hypothetical protein
MQDLLFGYLTTFYPLKKHRIRRGNADEYDQEADIIYFKQLSWHLPEGIEEKY